MNYDIKQIKSLLLNRRTHNVQKLTDRPISNEIIEDLIEAAHWAPTHGLVEPWKFLIIQGDERKKFADFNSTLYKKITAENEFLEKKYQKLKTTPLKVHTFFVLIMEHDPNGRIPEVENIEALACAVQNIHLLATAYDLGAKWSSGSLMYRNEVKTYFELNENQTILGYFYLGYPEDDYQPKAKRNSAYQDKMSYWKSK